MNSFDFFFVIFHVHRSKLKISYVSQILCFSAFTVHNTPKIDPGICYFNPKIPAFETNPKYTNNIGHLYHQVCLKMYGSKNSFSKYRAHPKSHELDWAITSI